MVLGQEGSLWDLFAGRLDALETDLRVRVVEQLARYLTYKQVPFLSDLLVEAAAAGLSVDPVESTAILDFLPAFSRTGAGERWLAQFEAFLSYFAHFSRHTAKDGESRERLREAFNTPLYPMILVANEVMQEGLDLHKRCRRVVHHDLVWNPAQVEQRIGRIEHIRRLGSLTNRPAENRRRGHGWMFSTPSSGAPSTSASSGR
jgi:Helicase conserved C-terminal domain